MSELISVSSAPSVPAVYGRVTSRGSLRHCQLAATRISLPKWIDWVQPHRLLKLFLVYKKAWWIGDRNPDMATGRVYTDLPLQQVFYFSPEWMQKHSSVQSSSSDKKEVSDHAMKKFSNSFRCFMETSKFRSNVSVFSKTGVRHRRICAARAEWSLDPPAMVERELTTEPSE